MRLSNRLENEIRTVSMERDVLKHAEGSCLVRFGDTHILCAATIEKGVPSWLRHSGKGWLSAEYAMLPRSTGTRVRRESAAGKQSGRSLEIQRFIGRSLRAALDLTALGEIQILIDCDVLQADGSTRTAAVTGGWIAMYDALKWLERRQIVKIDRVLKHHIAAVSCGMYLGTPILDLDYQEDSVIQSDLNFVMNNEEAFVEIQATSEGVPFTDVQFNSLKSLAKQGISELIALQKKAIL